MTSLIVVGAIALFVLITVFKGVRIVPQGEEWIVERLGRYHSTLKPGLNIVIPYMDVVAYRLPTKDIILDVQQQEIITKDNAVIVANALCFAKVVDPQKASYGVQDFSFAVTSLTMTRRGAVQPRADQGPPARCNVRADRRLGRDRALGGDSRHQTLGKHATGHGTPGRGRT